MSTGGPRMVLAGDIGGTHTRLALATLGEQGIDRKVVEEIVPSRRYARFEDLITEHALIHCPPGSPEAPVAACFGFAGPVRDGRVATTNLPWVVEADALARVLGVERRRLALINDLEAVAWGLGELGRADLLPLHGPGAGEGGAPAGGLGPGNAALLAPGTGLGVGGLFWDGSGHRPFASEGGHADFAPRGTLERALAAHLEARHGGHVSWERVLSGPGIVGLYEFLAGHLDEDARLSREQAGPGAQPARITAAGLDGSCPVAVAAVELFVGCLGALAGSLALILLATGGVFLAGGILPQMADALSGEPFRGRFRDAYLDKGRMGDLVASMPVSLVTTPQVGLAGALGRAALLAH